MKTIIEFNHPEDSQDLKIAQRGNEYYCIIFETLQEIRNYLKYGHQFKTVEEALEKIRETLSNANIDDIE